MCVVVCCSVLQRVAVCCNECAKWRDNAADMYVCGNVLQYVAACCSVLQSVLSVQNGVTTWQVCMCVVVCCSVLQRVAACCSVLQCVAVCCNEYWVCKMA